MPPAGAPGPRRHNGAIEEPVRIPPPPPARRRWALLAALVVAVAAAAVAAVLLLTGGEEERPLPPPAGVVLPGEVVGPDPLLYDPERAEAYERAAAFGLSHVIYEKSPGGVVAAARRTAAFRPLVETAVAGSEFDADTVEAMIMLESAGRPEVIAGDDPARASGLTQILAETAVNFLGMRVDLAASRELTKRIAAASRRGDEAAVERLRAERRRVDARFDPEQALAGTVRYLTTAFERFGRQDLAVVSYHMGIGNLESVLRRYSGSPDTAVADLVRDWDLSYARVYFDSSPARHREAWERLNGFSDDSQTYYWRVLAAREIMRLLRERPLELERLDRLHGLAGSAERVLHPPGRGTPFAGPEELAAALDAGTLLRMPAAPERLRYRFGPALGALASRLGADRAAYRGLRPQALGLLAYLATSVYDTSGAEAPLIVTGAAYDEAYAGVLSARDAEAARHAGLHTTGFAFDIRREYESGAQASAFQYVLERLEALGLIAWLRTSETIHVVVSPRAALPLPQG